MCIEIHRWSKNITSRRRRSRKPARRLKPSPPGRSIRVYAHLFVTEWTLLKKSMTVEPATAHTKVCGGHLQEKERDFFISVGRVQSDLLYN